MRKFEQIMSLVPRAPDYKIDWREWERSPFGGYAQKMKSTPQNPVWHGEGDVWIHTKMVCEVLVRDGDFRALSPKKQEILFISALMHDIGKTVCTVMQDGAWRSPRHAQVGSKMAREFLYRELGVGGEARLRDFRECVCAMIRYHGVPVHLLEKDDTKRKLAELASWGTLIPDFEIEMLRLLVRADILGRIGDDTAQMLEDAECAFMLANELGVMHSPYNFPDTLTAHRYLSGHNMSPDYSVFDDTWQGVVLVCGLPGVGKDTWIAKNYPSTPIISLDSIRAELKISPTDSDGQGKVVATAQSRAKELLRAKRSFVWNATNLTAQIRQKQLELFEKYGASVRIVFLEAEYETVLERNSGRRAYVPEAVIDKLIAKTEIPAPWEAREVEWITV